MTARQVSRVIGGMAVLGVLVIAAMVTWSVLRPVDPGPALPVAEGPALGDLTGYVGRVDRTARTLDVTDNLLGLRPVMLVVTDDTSIMVHGKQGALADLSTDMPVRVFYEVRDDVKYVTSLQVITDGAQASAPTAIDARPAVEDRPPPAPAATIVTRPRPVGPPPARAPGVRPSRGPTPAAPAPTEAASIGPTRALVSPAEADAGDGSAVIDWLFESRRR